MASPAPAGDPLAPAAVLALLGVVLPASAERGAGNAPPCVRGPLDLLAVLCHAVMVTVGFRFAGIGDDGPPAGPEKDAREAAPLPPNWNSGDSFAFRYTHPQSQMTFLVKGLNFGRKIILHAQGVEDATVHSLEVNANEFVAPTARFPYPSQPSDGADASSLRRLFLGDAALADLITRYKVGILQNLISGLNKPGYEEERTSAASSGGGSRGAGEAPSVFGPHGQFDPLRDPRGGGGWTPRGGGAPGFRGVDPPPLVGGGGPFSIGSRDLDPMASMGGYVDPRRIGGFDDGGGMIVGPDHPMFGFVGRGGRVDPRGGGDGGIYGGPQPLPPGSVPPGARFDPIGPFGVPPQGPGGRRPGGRGSPLSGEPDFDELPPPGYAGPFGGRPPGGFGGGPGFGSGGFGGNTFL